MQLTTRRFVLRDFTDDDVPAFVAYHTDPRSRTLYGPDEGNLEHINELVQLFKLWEAERPRVNFQFAVVLRNGILVGCAGLRMRDSEVRSAELGIELDPKYWGRFGYAIEIAKCLVDFGFGDTNLVRIVGRTVDVNMRVTRLAEAFGATHRDAITPDWMAVRGWRQIEWHITRDRWLASQSTGVRRQPDQAFRRFGGITHA